MIKAEISNNKESIPIKNEASNIFIRAADSKIPARMTVNRNNTDEPSIQPNLFFLSKKIPPVKQKSMVSRVLISEKNSFLLIWNISPWMEEDLD
jgi:hypothetical protein